MFKRNVVSLAVLTTLVATSAVAANKKDDQDDSVNSWGPWNGVQTAAGPGAGAAVPLLIQFANSQNNTDSSAFEAGAENDNAGLRQYHAWYSKGAHDKRKSTEQGYFTKFLVDDSGEETTFTYAIGTDAGDQERNPRVATFDGSEGGFVSYTKPKNSKRTIRNIPVDRIKARVLQDGPLPPVGTIVLVESSPVPVGPPGGAPMGPPGGVPVGPPGGAPMGPPGYMGPEYKMPPVLMKRMIVVSGKKGPYLKELPANARLVVEQQTGVRNKQFVSFDNGDKEGTFFVGTVYGGDEDHQRQRGGVKVGNKWVVKPTWSSWTGWNEKSRNNSSSFIYGQSSSIASVNQVLSGTGSAIYGGSFMGNGGNVTLTVNFGSSPSWSGSFNPAGDVPSFAVANGSIKGVDLAGAVTATKGITSGTVNASFFGNSAQHIAGIADVSVFKDDRFVEVFTTTEGVVPVIPEVQDIPR